MCDPHDLSLSGIERLCKADLTWKLVPLYDCPVEEGKSVGILCLSSTGDIDTSL